MGLFTASATLSKLGMAMAKAQGEVHNATQDKTNPYFESQYATLSACLDVGRPVLAKHALGLTQWPLGDVVLTVLLHESGEFMRSVYPVTPEKRTPQGYGSALSYARRYIYMAVLGMSSRKDDDDGEAATDRTGKKAAPKRQAKPAPPAKSPSQDDVAKAALKANKEELRAALKEHQPELGEGEVFVPGDVILGAITKNLLGKPKIETTGDCELVRQAIVADVPIFDLNTGARTMEGATNAS